MLDYLQPSHPCRGTANFRSVVSEKRNGKKFPAANFDRVAGSRLTKALGATPGAPPVITTQNLYVSPALYPSKALLQPGTGRSGCEGAYRA